MTHPRAMSGEELAEIKARADAATPGPWTRERIKENPQVSATADYYEIWPLQKETDHFEGAADATFIAHARTDIPRLLAHIDSLSTRTSGMTEEEAREVLASCIERSSPKADGLALSILHEREVAGAGCITVKEAVAAILTATSQLSQGNGAEEMQRLWVVLTFARALLTDIDAHGGATHVSVFRDKCYALKRAIDFCALPIQPAAKGEEVTEKKPRHTDKEVSDVLQQVGSFLLHHNRHDLRENLFSIIQGRMMDYIDALLAARKVKG